jgi:uncharacterized protein (TIGR03435 family)
MASTIWWLLVTACVTALDVRAQSQAASRSVLEVASIRRFQNRASPTGGAPSPGRLHLVCITQANLIRLAYLAFPTGQPNAPVSPTVFQRPISGGPAWINSERYSIEAKAESSVNVEMIEGPMMQALLEDRFKLKLHRETRKTRVFEITVAKGGPKLQPAKGSGCIVFDRNHPPPEPAPGQPDPVLCGSLRKSASGGFDFAGVTMEDLARQLSAYVDRDIIDKTGIKGVFDVHLELDSADLGIPDAPLDPSSPFTPGDGGAIASALKKLGIKMRAAKGPAEFLVIDHVERPSEN